MMGRLLLFLALFVAIFFTVKKLMPQSKQPLDTDNAAKPPENMRKCKHCGTYIAEKDSVQYQGNDFCSLEHKNEFRSSD